MKTYKVAYDFNILDRGIKLERRYCFIESVTDDEFTLIKMATEKIIELEEVPRSKFKLGTFSEVK